MAPGENNKTTMDLPTDEEDLAIVEKRSDAEDAATERTTTDSRALDNFDDEPDETLAERLWGLTEMFPESVRDTTYNITSNTWSGLKSFYSLSRNIVWIFVSSSVILFAPLIFEVERAQMEDMQRTQQKQMLLGPNTALAGGQGLPMPPLPR